MKAFSESSPRIKQFRECDIAKVTKLITTHISAVNQSFPDPPFSVGYLLSKVEAKYYL